MYSSVLCLLSLFHSTLTVFIIFSSHPTPLKDQAVPGGPQQALSPAQLPEEAECLTVPKYKRDLVQKLKILRQELSQQQPQAGHCRIEVCREEIFEVKQKGSLHTVEEETFKRVAEYTALVLPLVSSPFNCPRLYTCS